MEQTTEFQKTSSIMLDIDEKKINMKKIKFVINQLQLSVYSVMIYKSPSGKGWHIYLQLTTIITDLEICAIQALMGSDLNRETLNLSRIARNEKNWNKLFQYSWKKNKKGILYYNGSEIYNAAKTRRLQKLLELIEPTE